MIESCFSATGDVIFASAVRRTASVYVTVCWWRVPYFACASYLDRLLTVQRIIHANATERTAARVVGAAYLLAIPPAVFAEFYVRGRLLADDAAEAARNIV